MTRRKSALAIAALFTLVCASAHASGSGEVTREGTTTKLTNAYAYRQADLFDAKKMLTFVVFSTKPADTTKVNAAKDRIQEIESQLDQQQATYIELRVTVDGSLDRIHFQAPGLSFSGGGFDKPVLTRNDDKRIEGTFRTEDEKEKTSKFSGYYDLNFALDIPAAAPAKH